MAGNDGVIDLNVDTSLVLNASVPSVIGKVISDHVLNREEVISLIHKQWGEHTYGKVQITHLEDNLYIFSFESVASAKRVIQEGPWSIMGCFLCLQHWKAGMNVKEVSLTHIPIWVQIHGLKLDQMTEKNAKVIGNDIGKFLETDQYSLNHALKRGFLRVKVLLDCYGAIKTGMWVSRQGEATYHIDFKYERLAVFCSKCGHFGHLESKCEEEGLSQRQFGPRLRATEASLRSIMSNVTVKQKLPREKIRLVLIWIGFMLLGALGLFLGVVGAISSWSLCIGFIKEQRNKRF